MEATVSEFCPRSIIVVMSFVDGESPKFLKSSWSFSTVELQRFIFASRKLVSQTIYLNMSLAKSLQQYVKSLRPPRELILVLTKVDLVGQERATNWANHLAAQNPGARIVQVESYTERQVLTDGHGKKPFVDPHIPEDFLLSLVEALKSAHENLLKPPKALEQDSEKLKQWKPRVKEKIAWDAIWNKDGAKTQLSPPANPDATEDSTNQEDNDFDQRFLTIGLIGTSDQLRY